MSECCFHDMLPSHCEEFDQIMERVESLSDILTLCKNQRGPRIRFSGALDMLLQIAEAMLYLHGHGVAHRDLMPGNVLVASSSAGTSSRLGWIAVKLCVFDLTREEMLVNNGHKLVGIGSFYRAPGTLPSSLASGLASRERAREINWFKADVYSFGILCSEILSCFEELINWPEPTKRRKSGPLHDSEVLVFEKCSNVNPLSRPDFRYVFMDLKRVLEDLPVALRVEIFYGPGPYHGLPEVSLDSESYEFTRKVDPQLLMRYNFKEPVTRAVLNEQGRLLDELNRFRPSEQEPKHQILLSYCDADSSFVELLRKDLEARNVESLVGYSSRGNVSNSMGATKLCCVEIIVISEEYLSSECSILALVKYATERRPEHHILYPLFYKVSAHDLITESNLVHIMGRWSELAKTIPDVNLDQVTTAIDQLTSFALSANVSSYNDSANSEFGCRKIIVKDICNLLPLYLPYDTSNIIGCDRLCKELSDLFLEHNKTGVQVLGLYGLAGLGKTALSKALCNYFQKEVPRIRVCRLEFKIKDGIVGKRGA